MFWPSQASSGILLSCCGLLRSALLGLCSSDEVGVPEPQRPIRSLSVSVALSAVTL